MEERYLEAGGIGFIGDHMARLLLTGGGRLHLFHNCAADHPRNLSDLYDDVERLARDLRARDTWRRAGKSVTYLIQQAALPSLFHHWHD